MLGRNKSENKSSSLSIPSYFEKRPLQHASLTLREDLEKVITPANKAVQDFCDKNPEAARRMFQKRSGPS